MTLIKGFTTNMIVTGVVPGTRLGSVLPLGNVATSAREKIIFEKCVLQRTSKYGKQHFHTIEMEENEQSDLFVGTVDCMEDGQESSQVHTVASDHWVVPLVVNEENIQMSSQDFEHCLSFTLLLSQRMPSQ